MTPFGKHLDRSMKHLASEAVEAALRDAEVHRDEVQVAFVGNSFAGLVTGQECIRGETVLFPLGFGTIPMHNVENACATGGNALHLAWLAVTSGMCDTALALGVEKANHEDRSRTFSAYMGGMDVEEMFAFGDGAGVDRTPFVDRQAALARELMDERGVTVEAMARVAARALENGARNPMAHRRFGGTTETVLDARTVVEPITTLMSSPVSDGAAAAIVTRLASGERPGPSDVRIRASQMATRPPLDAEDGPTAATAAATAAYEAAGVGPGDLDVVEVHDASVAYELRAWSECGLCPVGDEMDWIESGRTEIGGALPVNPSGGLIARGHAVGASGIAQVYELVHQLRGSATGRQVEGARLALAQIGGGVIDWKTAASSVHVLEATSA